MDAVEGTLVGKVTEAIGVREMEERTSSERKGSYSEIFVVE